MIKYKFYYKDTGEIQSEHQYTEASGDVPLNLEKQQELLESYFGDSDEYYKMGILVNKGDNEVFFPDVIEKKGSKSIMKQAHLDKFNNK